jgi:hypothetical protein
MLLKGGFTSMLLNGAGPITVFLIARRPSLTSIGFMLGTGFFLVPDAHSQVPPTIGPHFLPLGI